MYKAQYRHFLLLSKIQESFTIAHESIYEFLNFYDWLSNVWSLSLNLLCVYASNLMHEKARFPAFVAITWAYLHQVSFYGNENWTWTRWKNWKWLGNLLIELVFPPKYMIAEIINNEF
jgi:hypothetical protein